MGVVRRDEVQIGFDIESGPIKQLADELNEVKKIVANALGADSFSDLTDEAKKAQEGVSQFNEEAKKTEKLTFSKLKSDIQKTIQSLTGGEKGVKGFTNALKNISKISFAKLKSSLRIISTKLTLIAKKAAGAAWTGLKRLASISFKALLTGLGALVTGLGAVMYKSVQSFANYEQLVGGVETLFGTGGKDINAYAKSVGKSVDEVKGEFDSLLAAQTTVLQNANSAYKTSGLSANAYMETVTSFSASLISSLGGDTVKAASYADQAITDMSDNANKMGTSMELIQNAYQGFAKQNYTMLDNLKLGYGGTKTEMGRLIKDAAKLDKSVKANDTSFGNIVKAIHAVQTELGVSGISYKEYTELVESGAMTHEEAFELLGTTAKEANFTVQGSLGQLKGAWENMLTAIGTGENLDQCFENMIESAEIFANNIVPVIERAVANIGTIVEKIVPLIENELPMLINKLLPPLAKAAGTLLGALITTLPSIISSLIPAIKHAASEIVKALYEGLTGKQMSTDAFSGIEKAIGGILNIAKVAVPVIGGLVLAFKGFNALKAGVTAVKGFATGIANIASKVTGGLAGKLTATSVGMKSTGTAAATSGKQVGTSATSFMKMGVAILAIGAGILLAAVGFALLAQSAIALANAGGPAIAVFFGMIVAIAALVAVMAICGTALTAAAVGMLAFGACVLMVGAGFALMGLGAMLAATALQMIVPLLPAIAATGLEAALGIAALGVALLVFAVGAGTAGLAAIALGAGLLVGAIGLALFAPALLLCALATLVLASAVQKLMPPIIVLISVIGTTLVNSIRAAGEAISGIIESVGTSISTVVTSISDGISSVTTSIGDAISNVLNSVANIIESIGNSARNAGEGFKLTAEGLRMIADIPIGSLIKSLAAVGTGLSDMAKHGEGVAQAGQGMMMIVSSLSAIIATAMSVGSSFTVMSAMISASATMSVATIKSMLQGIVSAIKSTNLATTGSYMIQGLIRGMNSKKAAAVNTARDIAQAINREFDKIEKIASPSKVWKEKGQFLIQGGIVGMEKLMPKLQATSQKAAELTMPSYGHNYTPESSTVTSNHSNNSEYNSYAPVFNFNISGNGDTRATARAVKNAAKQAVHEMFESMNRRTPHLQET